MSTPLRKFEKVMLYRMRDGHFTPRTINRALINATQPLHRSIMNIERTLSNMEGKGYVEHVSRNTWIPTDLGWGWLSRHGGVEGQAGDPPRDMLMPAAHRGTIDVSTA